MSYERLTKKGSYYDKDNYESDLVIELDERHYEKVQDIDTICRKLNRLAELEDKIENGTLVELPCKVGDTVYRVMADKRIKQPYEYKVIGFWYSINDKCNDLHLGRYIDGVFVSSISVPFSEFNRMLFLDKAKAEAKLKELKRKAK